MVDLALDGGFGQDLGGLLEGCGGQEGVGSQRGLGDTQQQTGAGGQTQLQTVVGLTGVDACLNGIQCVVVLDQINGGTGQQGGIAGILPTRFCVSAVWMPFTIT